MHISVLRSSHLFSSLRSRRPNFFNLHQRPPRESKKAFFLPFSTIHLPTKLYHQPTHSFLINPDKFASNEMNSPYTLYSFLPLQLQEQRQLCDALQHPPARPLHHALPGLRLPLLQQQAAALRRRVGLQRQPQHGRGRRRGRPRR